MGLQDLTKPAVEAAMREFNELGRFEFLRRYGFGMARQYFLEQDGVLFDSKAIAGVAHGKLPGQKPLRSGEFVGGESTVKRVLEGLGFAVVTSDTDARRNPTWSRDELILALDLYVKYQGNPPGKGSKEIVELSAFLNRMDSQWRGVTGEFRNANGVYMKIMNFRRFDPVYQAQGKVGLQRGGQDEALVWKRFANEPEALKAAAKAIRANVDEGASPLFDNQQDDIAEAMEGNVLTRQHRVRERNRSLIEAKKRAVLRTGCALACEACGFDFEERYGERGKGFIEVHHTKPLHTLLPGSKTRLEDLSLLCANCHRMVHARSDWLTVTQVAQLVRPWK